MSTIDEIKSRIDIVDLVSEAGVKLRHAGKNYTGFCPFHENKHTPAFVVWPESGTWRCFGQCNEGGDIFKFVMKKEGIDFKEALQKLASRAGVEIKEYQRETPQQREAYENLRKLLEDSIFFYRSHLFANKDILTYLREKRGLTDATIETFGLGYAPPGYDNILRHFSQRGVKEQELVDAGLLSERDDGKRFDRFRHRIMIPIRDENGKMAGFGARIVDPNDIPKFLNSPETPIFTKGHLLYGSDRARKPIRTADQAVIVEGYLDVIALHQAGYENVVSPMGTALTEDQMRLLKKFTRKIVLALDPDTAGQKAVLRGLEAARSAMDREGELGFDARGLLRNEARLQADLRVVPAESFGAAWHYFTGSKEHNVRLRQMGQERDLTINEYGVHKGTAEKKGKLLASKTEEDVYAAVGLPWIAPTLRENRGEFEAAAKGELPDLVEEKDLRGDLHMHSTFSDGSASMIDMARAAKDSGLEYIAITDHASPMGMVAGIKEGNIDEYLELVEKARKAVPGIRIFAGAEVDILPDGSLYLPDKVLKKLDWVNASIHANFNLDKAAQTKRFLGAIHNKHVCCIAHPTTRMVAERDGIEADWDAVFDAARECGVAMEMNASVRRLDMNDLLAKRAHEKGVTLTMGSDAHSISWLPKTHGVAQAQRAWLTKKDLLTCLPVAKIEAWLKKRR